MKILREIKRVRQRSHAYMGGLYSVTNSDSLRMQLNVLLWAPLVNIFQNAGAIQKSL